MELFQLKYKEEAAELINGIENSLLLMECNPDDPSLIEEVFRNMHTLKGNSGMFGFKMISNLTHDLESIYNLVRNGDIKISKQIINVTLSALDHLSVLVNNDGPLKEEVKLEHRQLSSKVMEIIEATNGIVPIKEPEIKKGDIQSLSKEKEWKDYLINFEPGKEFFLSGLNPLNLISELCSLGQSKVIAHVDNIPALEDIDTNSCYIIWDIYLTTQNDLKDIYDIFQFAEDKCRLDINEIFQTDFRTPLNSEVNESSDKGIKIKEISGLKIPASTYEEKVATSNTNQVISSIRVSSERLDSLMNLVSELMTLQAKLGTIAEQQPNTELLSVNENLEKISTRLRDNAFSMCLIPIEKIVMPFHRLVRDLATQLNKEIDFITEGTETELDKNIMEGLSDPLMHLIRNSIDHGIEDTATRIKSGKPKKGKIILRAYCAGTNVFIEIQDDGKGIDPNKIRNKAIENNIIGKEDILSEKEILNLIFLSGFSTAEQVSNISGRGVGMDVVKRKITNIRGLIKINSQINIGTTITVKLPITVSIIDGLLVKINDSDYVIPLSSVDRCYEAPVERQLNRFNNLIVLDGEQIPFISLTEEFNGIENTASSQEIVIVYYDDKKVALIVDSIVGKFQAVLKPLGKYFLQLDNISGATILGDGKIALVLDTNYVVEKFLNKKNVLAC